MSGAGVGLRVHASVVLVLLACLVAVVGWTVTALARQHERQLAVTAAERASQLEDAVARVAEDFDDVAGDLDFLEELVGQAPDEEGARHSVAALLGSVKRYRQAAVLDATCAPGLLVRDPRTVAAPDPPALASARDETLQRACRARPAGIIVSGPIDDPELKWLRVFARTTDVTVALVVDTAPSFDRLRTLTADASAELLVLGPHGTPAPVSAERPAATLRASSAAGPLQAVTDRMRAGEAGTAVLPRAEAVRLGYPDADVVIVFRPIPVPDALTGWSAAVLVSAERFEAHERSLMLGLLGSAAGGSTVLALLAAYVVRVARAEAAATERLRTADQVAHLRERAERILDHVPAGVVALGRDGEVVTATNVTLRRWVGGAGRSRLRELLGDSPSVERVEGVVATALRTGRVTDLTAERMRLFGREGTWSLHAVPLDPATAEVAVLLVVDDLSEVRSLQDQLLRTEKLATVGILAAGIAHEIGTPLGVIRGRAELVQRRLGADHAQAGSLLVIVQQIDRVARTIRALLDFAIPRPATPSEVDLRGPIDKVIDLVRYEAEKRKVALEVEIDDAAPTVRADGDQVQQVLVNLLMNALDATPEGGRVRIVTRSAVDATGEPCVALRVEDDGCGIPAEHLHRIFDPFFTTKKRGHGTGLGLAIVNQIARDNGGVVRVDSEPGRGTMVEVLLPGAGGRGVAAAARAGGG